MTDNPNAPNKEGIINTPILVAAFHGNTEIVKFLASLTKNPNAPNKYGNTPIHEAAIKSHTEIVKFLAPLTDNPNAPDYYGITPSSLTKNAEILRILGSFKKPKQLYQPRKKKQKSPKYLAKFRSN